MPLLSLSEEMKPVKNVALSLLLSPRQNCLPLAFSSSRATARAPLRARETGRLRRPLPPPHRAAPLHCSGPRRRALLHVAQTRLSSSGRRARESPHQPPHAHPQESGPLRPRPFPCVLGHYRPGPGLSGLGGVNRNSSFFCAPTMRRVPSPRPSGRTLRQPARWAWLPLSRR